MASKCGGVLSFLLKKEDILSDRLLHHICLVDDTDRNVSTCI